MRGREHVLLGAGSVVMVGLGAQAIGAAIPLSSLAMAAAAAAAGSLAPDLDHPGSLASLGIPATLLAYGACFLLLPLFSKNSMFASAFDGLATDARYTAIAWTAVIVAVLLFGLSIAAGAAFGHRGPVHSLVFGLAGTLGVLSGTLVLSGPLWIPLMFAWGWATHLGADATTKMGLPRLLWPFDEDRSV